MISSRIAYGNPSAYLATLRSIVDSFNAPIRFCVAYGSAVFSQTASQPQPLQHGQDNSMIDFIFGVTHSQHWHSLNLRQNPDHYSSLMRLAGSRAIQLLQEEMGAHIYYNTGCHVNGMRIKYGVISIDHLVKDLENWDTLYCAGRFQKPVEVLRYDSRVDLSQKKNLKYALNTALLLLPEHFTEEQLYVQIARLSYIGDFRFLVFGEDPRKVQNIVQSQTHYFRETYEPLIKSNPSVYLASNLKYQQDKSSLESRSLLKTLPETFINRVISHDSSQTRKYKEINQLEDLIDILINSKRLELSIEKALTKTVRKSSIQQAFKGILTAGLGQSIRYAGRKLEKGLFK